MMFTLFLLFSLLALSQGDYTRVELTNDGQGHDFLFPQMTCSLSNQNIVVFHYNVNGVSGQSGLSIITRLGGAVASISTILPSVATSTQPPGQFVNDPYLASYPYSANYMHAYFDSTINTEVIEMIIPVQTPIQGGVQMQMVGMVIDTAGHYIRPLDTTQLRIATVPYSSNNQVINLSVSYVSSTRTIVVGGANQAFNRAIDLTSFWQHAQGRVTLSADLKTVGSPAQTKLVVVLDDSNQAYPYINQIILILDPLTGDLIEVIDPMITYDSNQLVAYGKRQVSVTNDQALILCQPSSYGSRSVYIFTPSTPSSSPVLTAGQVDKVWFTNLGYLAGQGVLSDSYVVTTIVSSTQLYARTQSVQITSPVTKQVVSSFTSITGVTSTALAAGASSSLTDYLILTLYVDSQDHIYMSNFYQDGYSTGVVPGVLIVTRSGEFIDWYTGFDLPQTVSIDRSGYMLVPDRWQNRLHVINLATHTVIQSAVCGGCMGVAYDTRGGYVVTTSNQYMNSAAIEFMNTDYTLNSAYGSIQFTFYSGYSDQAALSNPVTDSQGRIYVLISSVFGQSHSTGKLTVYDPVTKQMIAQNDWANPQPRGVPGVCQLSYASTLSLNHNDQSIVAATVDFGQIFQTKPF